MFRADPPAFNTRSPAAHSMTLLRATQLSFAVGEPVERGDPLRVERIERLVDLVPIARRFAQRMAAYCAGLREHPFNARRQFTGPRVVPDTAQRLDVGNEGHKWNQIARLGAVDVVGRVRDAVPLRDTSTAGAAHNN